MSNAYYTGKCGEQAPHRIYMNRMYIERRDFLNDLGACFINEDKDICRQIVDPWGNIRNFPGVEICQELEAEYPSFQGTPIVRNRARFSPYDGEKILVVWTIRRDGREWMDHDGFGGEEYCSVRMYSFLDENGDFTQPFRLYAIGDTLYGQWAFPDDVNRYKDRKKTPSC